MMLDLHGPENITEAYCCVLCVQRHCTFYTRPQDYSLMNDDHTRYTTWRSLFSMVLFVAEQKTANAPSTREVSVFLTRVRVQTLPQNQGPSQPKTSGFGGS